MRSDLLPSSKKVSLSHILLLCGIGIGAGFANGLLGAGGGILVVFGLWRVLGAQIDRRDIFACALCVMIPLSAISATRYAMNGNLSFSGFKPYWIPALAGGIIGGILLSKLQGKTLKKIFGALVVWSGIMLIIR